MENFIEIFGNQKISPADRFVTAIGVFDGVHPGHRKIIETAKQRAQKSGAGVMALSFSPHPRVLLASAKAPELLISEAERVQLLHDAGADVCAFINFTPQVAAMEPEDFLLQLQLNGIFTVCGICVGSNWRFGCKGSGDRDILSRFCMANNWTFDAVTELTLDGITISSSEIRQAIHRGDLSYARRMLGREISLRGTVAHGHQIAGTKLAAPTANLIPDSGVLPPFGVYSGECRVQDTLYPAAVNIGIAPTFGKNEPRIEIHLLGFNGSLYGHNLKVTLHKFIRQERKFASPEELKEQISRDITQIKQDFSLQKNI